MLGKCAIAGAAMLGMFIAGPSSAQETLDAPVGWIQPESIDSGVLANALPASAVAYSTLIEVEGAAWLRLYFDDVNLGPQSHLRVTSMLDGEVQVLDAAALQAWRMSTAYFNGDAVRLELIAGPGAHADRVAVASVGLDVSAPGGEGGQCGICGSDTREPVSDLWIARLMPAGCTASVVNSRSCMLTAGHCANADVVQFNVPASNPDCGLVNPPVADQFPIAQANFTNNGVGNDWGVLVAGTNGEGQTPYERYGEHRPVATAPVGSGTFASLTGYGSDTTCVLNKTLQFDDGTVTAVTPGFYQFAIDLRAGNSGSALLAGGQVVGVATHCPCPNAATRVDVASFAARARRAVPDAWRHERRRHRERRGSRHRHPRLGVHGRVQR